MLDFLFGITNRELLSNAKSGDIRSQIYLSNECKSDILIFGSSRAQHHYNPKLIEDSLNLSTYNCGQDGCGIITMYGRLLLLLDRYTPKVVVYDINGDYDVIQDDNTKYIKSLLKFSKKDAIRDYIIEIGPWSNKYKLMSNLWKYNFDFISFVESNIISDDKDNYRGYTPLYGTYDGERIQFNKNYDEWDSVKKKYMVRFINLCKTRGIQLIFMYSPYFTDSRPRSLQLITKLCMQEKIPLINHYTDCVDIMNNSSFVDCCHLNKAGSDYYTRVVIEDIKSEVDL